MNKHYALQIGNDSMLLLADKALYWPQQQTLMIADAHFGKAAAYRALGQPVPQGTTTDNLRRLDALLASYPVQRIIFLGDFLHAPRSHAPATLAALMEWRQRNVQVQCLLVRGNHDKKAGDPPHSLAIEVVDEPYLVGNFALQHLPNPHSSHHVIAGHVHPTFRLHGKGRQHLTLPCFQHEQALTLLPAFGEFTGGYRVQEAPGRQIFVTDGSHGIWPMSEARPTLSS